MDLTSTHDPGTRRTVPERHTPLEPARVEELLAREWDRFPAQTPASGEHNKRASQSLPLGVTSSFQHWDPYPISITVGQGRLAHRRRRPAAARPVDGVRRDARRATSTRWSSSTSSGPAETGTLFVTPSPPATEVAERFQRRFGLGHAPVHQLRAPSRSMYAIRDGAGVHRPQGDHQDRGRLPRRLRRVAGLGEARRSRTSGRPTRRSRDVPFDVEAGTVHVVAYNDLPMLEQLLAQHGSEVACVVMEPVIENLAHRRPGRGIPRRRTRAVRPARRRSWSSTRSRPA